MPHVAYEANAGMAVVAAWEADVSRSSRVSCCFLFSPGPFFDDFVGDHLFAFPQLLIEEAAPAAAVCRIVFPALRVDSQGSHISFAHVLVPQLWAATGSFANGKFSIEDVLWYSAIFHAVHMANPAYSALSE